MGLPAHRWRTETTEHCRFSDHRPEGPAHGTPRPSRYPGARRRGLPIGSGATEATCKSLITVRMKRSGARWKEVTARQVIHLRALALSDRWDTALQLTLAPVDMMKRLVSSVTW